MTHPVPAVAKTALIIDWLAGLGWDVTQETGFPLYPGPEILMSPDKAVFITPTPGPGYVTEEAGLDAWGFQVRLRGPDNDPLTADLAVQQLDSLILNGPYPTAVDGIQIAFAGRAGSSPSPLPQSPDDQRFEWTCTYIITTGGG